MLLENNLCVTPVCRWFTIKQRTKAGIEAARKRGKQIGRPKALSSEQIEQIHTLKFQGMTHTKIASELGVSSRTITRILNQKDRT